MIRAVITVQETSDRLTVEINKGNVTRFVQFDKATEKMTTKNPEEEMLVNLLASMLCTKYGIEVNGVLMDVKYDKSEAEAEAERLRGLGAKVDIV